MESLALFAWNCWLTLRGIGWLNLCETVAHFSVEYPVISREPYKRRPESEMIEILTEIHSGRMSKRGACEKYGINRNTMALFIKKYSLRTLGQNISNQLLSDMPEENKTALLEKKIKELTRQLDHEKLKNASLETMIKVAEEDLHIRIKKKRGTKRSIE